MAEGSTTVRRGANRGGRIASSRTVTFITLIAAFVGSTTAFAFPTTNEKFSSGSSLQSVAIFGNDERIELLELGRSGIHVAEYLISLPSKEVTTHANGTV